MQKEHTGLRTLKILLSMSEIDEGYQNNPVYAKSVAGFTRLKLDAEEEYEGILVHSRMTWRRIRGERQPICVKNERSV